MIFKFKYRTLGGHTHVQMFAGKTEHSLGLCGNLTLRNEEWNAFRWHLEEGNVSFEFGGTGDRLIIEEKHHYAGDAVLDSAVSQ